MPSSAESPQWIGALGAEKDGGSTVRSQRGSVARFPRDTTSAPDAATAANVMRHMKLSLVRRGAVRNGGATRPSGGALPYGVECEPCARVND
jgi:hypothetical protein